MKSPSRVCLGLLFLAQLSLSGFAQSVISKVAGNGTIGFSGDWGQATEAALATPEGGSP